MPSSSRGIELVASIIGLVVHVTAAVAATTSAANRTRFVRGFKGEGDNDRCLMLEVAGVVGAGTQAPTKSIALVELSVDAALPKVGQ